MSFFSKLDRHSGLVGRMANTLGADVLGASLNGQVPETALRTAVFGCTRCQETGQCELWLKEHPDGAGEAPDYCRNKAMLDKLSTA